MLGCSSPDKPAGPAVRSSEQELDRPSQGLLSADQYSEAGIVRVGDANCGGGRPFLGVFLNNALFVTSGRQLLEQTEDYPKTGIQITPAYQPHGPPEPPRQLSAKWYDFPDADPAGPMHDVAIVCLEAGQRLNAPPGAVTWPRLTTLETEKVAGPASPGETSVYVVALGLKPTRTEDDPNSVQASGLLRAHRVDDRFYRFAMSTSANAPGFVRTTAGAGREWTTYYATELNLGSPVYLPGTHDLVGVVSEAADAPAASFEAGIYGLSAPVARPPLAAYPLARWLGQKASCMEDPANGPQECCARSIGGAPPAGEGAPAGR